jgi:hypothetical protein
VLWQHPHIATSTAHITTFPTIFFRIAEPFQKFAPYLALWVPVRYYSTPF